MAGAGSAGRDKRAIEVDGRPCSPGLRCSSIAHRDEQPGATTS
ncbi:hypothetical protein [Nocardioides plantarum]